MKGIIIINPYRVPEQSVKQAERLKKELERLGASAEIVADGYARVCAGAGTNSSTGAGARADEGKSKGTGKAENGAEREERGMRLDESFSHADFFVYFDKDKYVSSLLEKAGKRVFDLHETIRLCDDKGDTYIELAAGGFPVPKTIFAPLCYSQNLKTPEEFFEVAEKELSYPMIVKESYGSMGKGVYKAENRAELETIQEKLKTVPHLLQKYEGARHGTDMRVIVVGGKAAAAMLRINENDFRSNIALGGRGIKVDFAGATRAASVTGTTGAAGKVEACENNENSEYSEFITLAERAARYLKADYCGVDLLFDKNGKPIICEVNSNAFFGEIEKVTGVNVARLYAEYIVKTVKTEAEKA